VLRLQVHLQHLQNRSCRIAEHHHLCEHTPQAIRSRNTQCKKCSLLWKR
jgi:hypothetical protein